MSDTAASDAQTHRSHPMTVDLDEHLPVIRKALERHRIRMEEVAALGWYKDSTPTDNEIARIDAALAALERTTTPQQVEWTPLADGVHQWNEQEGIVINGAKLEARVRPLETFTDSLGQAHRRLLMIESVEVNLPDNLRLCRRTTTPQPMPSLTDDDIATLRSALAVAYMNVLTYHTPQGVAQALRYETLLGRLKQQRREPPGCAAP